MRPPFLAQPRRVLIDSSAFFALSDARDRTAPLAGIVYDLVLLWYAARVQHGLSAGWLVRPWYRSKTAPSFLDLLTAVRQASSPQRISAPACPPQCLQNAATPSTTLLLDAA